MAENTNISWCDATFNPFLGCTKVSPACKNCYAERDMDHRYGKVVWGPGGTRVLTTTTWPKPIQWNKEAEKSGKRIRVFCASLADVFEDWQRPIQDAHGNRLAVNTTNGSVYASPDGLMSGGYRWMTMDDIRDRLFKLIDATPNLDWLLLTKRPENIFKMWPTPAAFGMLSKFYGPLGFDETGSQPEKLRHRTNVWLGTSVESQEYADKRIPELLKCRDLSPVLFLSCEPLVGPVDLRPALWLEDQYFGLRGKIDRAIDWIITGGESGPEARPNHPEWFRDLRDQAGAARIPFHFKQWGEWGPESTATPTQINNADYTVCERGERLYRVGKKAAGRELDGVVHDAFPEVAR